MNKKEFAELTQEVANICYAYERFCKDGYLFDLRYSLYFYEERQKLAKLDFENTLLTKAIKAINDGKSKEELDSLYNASKAEYEKVVKSIDFKKNKAEIVISATDALSKEDIEDFNKVFKAFIDLHHPAILYRVRKEEAMSYDNLKLFFYENNISGFQEYLDLNQQSFNVQNIIPEQYVDAAKYFYALQNQIKTEMLKKSKQYPYTKYKVFEDEMTIAAEHGDLRATLSKFSQMNKSLHADFTKLNGCDFNL